MDYGTEVNSNYKLKMDRKFNFDQYTKLYPLLEMDTPITFVPELCHYNLKSKNSQKFEYKSCVRH